MEYNKKYVIEMKNDKINQFRSIFGIRNLFQCNSLIIYFTNSNN
jgi:hypothetical protein